MLIDTHSHLFLEEFAEDLPQVMERARNAGVSSIFIAQYLTVRRLTLYYPFVRNIRIFCYPMIGLHPTSVNETYEQELAIVRERFCRLPIILWLSVRSVWISIGTGLF